MRINLFLIVLFGLFTGCMTPSYLPDAKEIDVNQHGSFINVNKTDTQNVLGELISVDSMNIIVLNEETLKCVAIPRDSIKSYSLSYARPKHYGWSIGVLTVLTIGHGYFAAFTLPANLVGTSVVTTNGELAYKIRDSKIPFEKLKMFARFPQGIPQNLSLEDIKFKGSIY